MFNRVHQGPFSIGPPNCGRFVAVNPLVHTGRREIAALFEEAPEKRRRPIRGEADEPVVAKNRANKRKK